MAEIIMKGSEVSSSIQESLTGKFANLEIVKVGARPDDLSYQRGIIKRFSALGFGVNIHELPENISQSDFDSEFERINKDSSNQGILLFRPLPSHLSDEKACKIINPFKDIDCMSPINLAGVFAGVKNSFAPCTALAVMEMLNYYKISLTGQNVVIVGRSLVLGRPLSMLMLSENATVTICHSKTKNLAEICKRADIIIAAAGQAGIITPEFVNDKSVIVDVGINLSPEGKICGDVDYERVAPIVHAISPVPGGVGAVTTSVLAKILVKAAILQR